jgi:hypothetical protein
LADAVCVESVDVRGLAFGLDVWARAALETSTPITAAAVATLRFISLSLAVTLPAGLNVVAGREFQRGNTHNRCCARIKKCRPVNKGKVPRRMSAAAFGTLSDGDEAYADRGT